MTRRRRVSIRIEHLVTVHERQWPAFFVDWRCRLCHHAGHAIDRTAALDECVEHLAQEHRASGGYRRSS